MILVMMYDETKHLTFEERNAYFREGIDDICKEFSIKLVSVPYKDFAYFGHTVKHGFVSGYKFFINDQLF